MGIRDVRNIKGKDAPNIDAVAKCADLLEMLGCDLEDPNFVGTPERMWRSLQELIQPREAIEELIERCMITFPSDHQELVVIADIDAYGVCPHHILPVHYRINFAYIPNGVAIGLSKIPRIVRGLARRPVLQEDLTKTIADLLEAKLDAAGIFVQVYGRHDCMVVRGSKSHAAETITSAVRGLFKSEPALRAEALDTIRNQR